MSTCSSAAPHTAGIAFDSIADQYDDMFTRSLIGRAQRDVVWEVLRQTFRAGEHVLELNCGTGEDAMFLAAMGISVYACDASERMIAVAARRMAGEPHAASVRLEVLPTERIESLNKNGPFDGVVSNFSGLNCVTALSDVVRQLANLIKPAGRMVLCLSSRFCLWETLWFLMHGDPARATRRWKGSAVGSLGKMDVLVQYPTLRDLRREFSPHFRLCRVKGVGVSVPPSYVEPLARRYPRPLKTLRAIDSVISNWPVCRVIGDHMLLVLERNAR